MIVVEAKPWDTAEVLNSKEDIAAYLEAVAEEGWDDPAFMALANPKGLGRAALAV
jgi:DNA-binding phage protein